MALVYFDSSALVKLVVEEPGTALAAQLWDGCDAAVSSRLAYPEVRAALAAARRNRNLDAAGFERAWEQFWGTTRPVELSKAVERQAGELAGLHGREAPMPVNLASALAIAVVSALSRAR